MICGQQQQHSPLFATIIYQIQNFSLKFIIYVIKHMVNTSPCTVELWMHLGDVLGGLLSSQELEV